MLLKCKDKQTLTEHKHEGIMQIKVKSEKKLGL